MQKTLTVSLDRTFSTLNDHYCQKKNKTSSSYFCETSLFSLVRGPDLPCLLSSVYKLLVRDYYMISHVGTVFFFFTCHSLLEMCAKTLQASNKQTIQFIAEFPDSLKQVVL